MGDGQVRRTRSRIVASHRPAGRAAQSHDLKAEVAFRRLLAQVTGLTRTEPEDALAAFVQTVRRIAGAPMDTKPALGPPKGQRRAGTPSEPTARPIADPRDGADPDYDLDAEALEQFDREN